MSARLRLGLADLLTVVASVGSLGSLAVTSDRGEGADGGVDIPRAGDGETGYGITQTTDNGSAGLGVGAASAASMPSQNKARTVHHLYGTAKRRTLRPHTKEKGPKAVVPGGISRSRMCSLSGVQSCAKSSQVPNLVLEVGHADFRSPGETPQVLRTWLSEW
jgi:hypothetical protein